MSGLVDRLTRRAEDLEGLGSLDISDATRKTTAWQLHSAVAMNRAAKDNVEAADKITSLQAENASLREQVEKAREALEPFAKYAVSDGFGLDSRGNPLPDGESPGWVYVTNGDFRRARRTMDDILREQAERPVLRPARALKDKEERG